MANEFVARKGLLVASGSLLVASGSVTASNFVGTASAAISSSYATTASYALTTAAGAGFPFSGSALITGSLYVSGGFVSGSFVGDGSGLDINASPVTDIYKFVGDGTTQLYVVSQSYYRPNVQVSVDGLVFTEGVDYTYTTGSISFVIAPPSSSNILINALLNAKNSLTGSFTGSFIGDGRGLRNIPLAIDIETYKFSGDGSTTNYVLSHSYGANSLFVTVNGITYISPEDFSISGGTLSFTEVPISASNILVRAFISQSFIDSASQAVTASYVEFANVANKPTLISSSVQINTGSFSGSFVGNLIGTSSWASDAISSSYAHTSSYALNAGAGSGFPFSGSAVITGSLLVVPTASIGGITGSFSGSGEGLTNLRASLGIDAYLFTGNGSQTNFILSQSYIPNSVLVSVEGINYAYTDDFTLSGPTMSFVTAPPSESNVIVKAFLAVSSGSYINYTGSFIGNGYGLTNLRAALAIDEYTFVGNGATTQYILSSSYAPQSLNITVGGLRYVSPNDYSITGSTLNFVQAPASESLVVIDAFLTVSSGSIGTFSGSFLGNATTATSASYATTSSFASNVLKTKAGSLANTSFGGTPYTASVTFSSAFSNTNYSIAVTGEDARIFTIESKTAAGFVVNTNSNTVLTGTTYWTCTAFGEN